MSKRFIALISVASGALLGVLLDACSSDSNGAASNGGAGDAGSSGATEGGGSSNGGATSSGGGAGANGAGSPAAGGVSSGGGRSGGGGGRSDGGSAGLAAGGGATSSGGTAASGGTGGTSSGGTSSGGKSGASGGGAASGGAGGSGNAHTGAWKVMMLGDSVTAATCYPQLVSKTLIAGGHTNFQFIGTQTNQQSCSATQVREEGHGGYGVTYLPQNSTREACQKPACGSYAELQTWAAEKPEIVLMHFGTNDVWDGQSPSNILSAYVSVIAEFRKQNPSVVFFVSKIIKLNPSGCTSCLTNVAALVAAVTDSWATANSLPSSPVFIVDDYDSGFDPNSKSDTSDGVHPTPSGALKVASATASAVIAKNYF